MLSTRQQVWYFATNGSIGFIVDDGILALLNSEIGLDLTRSRIVSFAVAVAVSCYLNRQRTFVNRKGDRAAGEWGRCALVNGFGAGLNMTIFFLMVHEMPGMSRMPLIPPAVASGFAMFGNSFESKCVAFRKSLQ